MVARDTVTLDGFVGDSPAIRAVRDKAARLLGRVGRQLPGVLILGETGTGKTLLVRSMHRASARRDGPCLECNSAGVPEGLVETEMFGTERGAYTGAHRSKQGLFQQAHGGTLFLDEVGLMSPALQGKLLKAIEDRAVRRLHGERIEPVDIWVVAATSVDIPTAIREGKFREDLYHRLAVITLTLPPLRERGEDIIVLAESIMAKVARDYGVAPLRLDASARSALLEYDWPGNVRELANLMQRVTALADADVVTADLLNLPVRRRSVAGRAPSLREELGGLEQDRLAAALRECGGNLSRAAERLNMRRNTLRYRLQKYGLLPSGAGDAVVDASSQTARTWEPRRLTVLRAVVPASPDDRVAAATMIEAATHKLAAFGGIIEERSETGVAALFGVEAVEDAPRRAAHAALALHRAAEERGAGGRSIALKVAIHTARVDVAVSTAATHVDGDGKHAAWSVLDELLAATAPGSTTVCAAAASFLHRRFELAELAMPRVAGAPAYRLLGAERPGFGARRSTFVGRRHELELLRSYLTAVTRGEGRVVGIVGDPGIGKSRLMAEFRLTAGARAGVYLEGACLSYATAIPYVPVLGVLRQACELTESDTPATIAARVRERLEALGMDASAAAPFVLELFGVRDTDRLGGLPPETIRLRTAETLRRMITGASRQSPLVLVVEDLQWADKPSIDVLEAIVDELPGAPMLLVATYRPGCKPSWLDRSFATQIAIGPLSADDSRLVMRDALPGEVPPEVAQSILDKAEGNPFFLEEMCRSVVDGAAISVPDTVEELVRARIERLPEESRKLLQCGAVLGRRFSADLAAAMWPGSGPLDAHAAVLRSQEFLYRHLARERVVYVFKHALTQEVTYGNLPPAERRALHGAAGRALEASVGGRSEEAYDALAYHYARSDDAVRAVACLTRFADRAARGGAHDEALHALRDALPHVDRLPAPERDRRRLEVALRLAVSLLPLGRIAELFATLLAERDCLERVDDPRLTAQYHFALARGQMLGQHDRAADSARRAIAAAARCGDTATMGGAYGVLALADVLTGDARQGIEDARQAVTLLRSTGERWSLAYAYWALGFCLSVTGAFDEALTAEHEALAIAESIGATGAADSVEVSATWAVGIIQAALGDCDEGIARCQSAVNKARDVLYRAISLGCLGFAYLENGETERAIAALEAATPLLERFGVRAFEAWFTSFLAEAHRAAGHLDRAEAVAGDALARATSTGFGVAAGWAHQTLGRIAAERGDLAGGAARLTEALRTFARLGSRYELARTHVDLACLRRATGERVAARSHLEEAHATFEGLGIHRHRERVERLAREWEIELADSKGRG